MDEAKLITGFVASNLDKILSLAREAYDEFDQRVQVKLRTAYTNYLRNTTARYSKAKSFFIRNQPANLYDYYVPIGLQCDSTTIREPSPCSCFSVATRIVISGSGGCGKSVLMRHLFLSSIRDRTFVPVFVELRDLNTDGRDLKELIGNTLTQHGFDPSVSYLDKALEAGHVALFLDGYDEVYPAHRAQLIGDISELSAKYPKCPVVLSTRPDDVVRSLEEFVIFAVNPLDLEGAVGLIAKLPYDADVRRKFTDDLRHGLFEKHESFLSNPLLLSIMLLTYGENAEIPRRRSVFYNQAYEALFQRHDASKGGFRRKKETDLDIQDFAGVFGLFCLQTYEKRIFEMSNMQALEFIDKAKQRLGFEFPREAYLRDLLSATCLLIEDGFEIMYTHRSFQEYFVALYIASASDEIQKSLLHRYWKFVISDSVIDLVEELNPESIERNLLIPKLTNLFTKLRVSRDVGITHAARYVKLAFSHIRITKEGVGATLNRDEYTYMVLYLACRMCNSYKFPDEEYFGKQAETLLDKYADGKNEVNDRISFETSTMSYRSPLLRDVLAGEGVMSLSYLRAGHRAWKLLEKKHGERLQSLDKLLSL